jgi:hypothetical protein
VSVVIDDLQVEVLDQPEPPPSQTNPPSKRHLRLRPLLQAMCERDERLKAD